MDLQLTGKRALVTGSTSGIGRGIATVLAREGAIVIVHGRNGDRAEAVAAAIRSAGGTAHVALGDLATDAGGAAVAEAVGAATGGLDILVNNIGGNEAAGGGLQGWFNDTPSVWTGTMQQNLVAPVRMIHAFVPAMRERGWGRVINVSSGGGSQPTPQAAAYCAAKAAVNNLTISLSIELARSGVTVNTISPGCTRTEMFERTLTSMGEANGWPEDMDQREAKFMDLGLFPCSSTRYGRPQDIGTLVAFLASPLSDFVNGANYRIDGGQVQSVN
jgi:NAD(P)-dependent dehydrogenase (short-subunit alcohol dehydrogenase family)